MDHTISAIASKIILQIVTHHVTIGGVTMFYKNFVYLCEKNGVSRSNVCKKLGLSENAWKRWENESTPRKSTVLAVSRFFGVSYEDLLHKDLSVQAEEKDEDIVDARQYAFERRDLRILFDIAPKAPPSKIYEVISILEKYQEDDSVDS